MHKHMEDRIGFSVGVVLAFGVAYALYRVYKKNKIKKTRQYKIIHVERIDYEYLFEWLKNKYNNRNNGIKYGCKFGIMPSAIAKKTYSEEFSADIHLTKGEDALCVFILDEKEENIISSQYYIYKEMGQSLKDILHSDKVYIQELKK